MASLFVWTCLAKKNVFSATVTRSPRLSLHRLAGGLFLALLLQRLLGHRVWGSGRKTRLTTGSTPEGFCRGDRGPWRGGLATRSFRKSPWKVIRKSKDRHHIKMEKWKSRCGMTHPHHSPSLSVLFSSHSICVSWNIPLVASSLHPFWRQPQKNLNRKVQHSVQYSGK